MRKKDEGGEMMNKVELKKKIVMYAKRMENQ